METILCPTCFSPASENAIRYADELAQRMNTRLVLFHNIYEPAETVINAYSGLPYDESLTEVEYREALLEKLEALKKSLENSDWGMPVQYETAIRYGLTKDTVPRVVQEVQADLIVVAKEEGLKDLFEGSVVTNILQVAPCPVLLIPPKYTFRPLRKIVFATDLLGEPFTDVAFVTKLASLFEAEITFLHIIPEELPDSRYLAQVELDRLHKRLSYKNATFHIEVTADIEKGISQFCHRHKADMLVMGYHPHHRLWQHLFTPNNTMEVVYQSSIPLLVIHYNN